MALSFRDIMAGGPGEPGEVCRERQTECGLRRPSHARHHHAQRGRAPGQGPRSHLRTALDKEVAKRRSDEVAKWRSGRPRSTRTSKPSTNRTPRSNGASRRLSSRRRTAGPERTASIPPRSRHAPRKQEGPGPLDRILREYRSTRTRRPGRPPPQLGPARGSLVMKQTESVTVREADMLDEPWNGERRLRAKRNHLVREFVSRGRKARAAEIHGLFALPQQLFGHSPDLRHHIALFHNEPMIDRSVLLHGRCHLGLFLPPRNTVAAPPPQIRAGNGSRVYSPVRGQYGPLYPS